jgi:CRP/FNR family transcriptional regulator
MDEVVRRLRQVPLFASLPEQTLARVARAIVPHTYAADEIVIVEGEPCRAAYFVIEGQMRVYRLSVEGREQVLAQLGPGQGFNTVPAFQEPGRNHATVQAMGPALLYAIPVADLQRLVAQESALSLAIIRDFAHRLDHLTDLVEGLALHTVRGRLARFLLDHADAGAVTRRWTQEEMANRLGTVRDMVGRTLRSFADAGLIRMDRQRIVLLDREGLVDAAEH